MRLKFYSIGDWIASFVYAMLQLLQIVLAIVVSLVITYTAYFLIVNLLDMFLDPETLALSFDNTSGLLMYFIFFPIGLFVVCLIVPITLLPAMIAIFINGICVKVIRFFMTILDDRCFIYHILENPKFKKCILVITTIVALFVLYRFLNVYDFNLNLLNKSIGIGAGYGDLINLSEKFRNIMKWITLIVEALSCGVLLLFNYYVNDEY